MVAIDSPMFASGLREKFSAENFSAEKVSAEKVSAEKFSAEKLSAEKAIAGPGVGMGDRRSQLHVLARSRLARSRLERECPRRRTEGAGCRSGLNPLEVALARWQTGSQG